MRTIRLIIVDDEASARDLLRNLLAGIDWIKIVGEAADVDEALPLALKERPDVLLLDIQMPRKDGFTLVEKLLQHELAVEIIFITAYEKYALKAIKASAFDYLLKPVKKAELLESLDKLSVKVSNQRLEERFRILMSRINDQQKLKFKHRTGFYMINPEDIIYCQADSNYTILELDSGKSLMISMNLGKVEEILPSQLFCRVSRSLIIQVKLLSKVDRRNMTIELIGGKVPLSISRKNLTRLEECCDTGNF